MLLVKKCHFLNLFRFGQNKSRNNAYVALKREKNRFDYKNSIFQSLKDRIFSKGLTHAFGQKMPFFS